MRPSNFGDRPFDFESMFDRMNRQFAEMNRQFTQFADRPALESGMALAPREEYSGVRLDVAEHDDDVVVTADLPGFEKEHIDLSIAGDALTISADRDIDTDEESESYVRCERRHQSVRRTISLPVDVDEEAAMASYTNGVLSVTLPKVVVEEDDDSHRIDID